MSARKTQRQRIEALVAALRKIERQTHGYSDQCELGLIHRSAKAALNKEFMTRPADAKVPA